MKTSQMFPRKYATGEDLAGKTINLTIKKVTAEAMRPAAGAAEETKYVIYFVEAVKGVILSKTLAEQISEAVSNDETNDWPGKKISLFPQPMKVAGVQRIAIRAKKANGGAPPPASLQDEEEEKF